MPDPRDAEFAELRAENAELRAKVAELTALVEQLRAELARNSLNSSLPRSRDDQKTRKKRWARATKTAKLKSQKDALLASPGSRRGAAACRAPSARFR